jgi:hypothetical protein
MDSGSRCSSTPESFHAKEILTHKAYERIRDIRDFKKEGF